MIKYKSWFSRPEDLWGGDVGQPVEKYTLINLWKDFIDYLKENNLPIPDLLCANIEEYVRLRQPKKDDVDIVLERNDGIINPVDNANEDNDLPNQDDWMFDSNKNSRYISTQMNRDPNGIDIYWQKDHDWSILHNKYTPNELSIISSKYKSVLEDKVSTENRRHIERKTEKFS